MQVFLDIIHPLLLTPASHSRAIHMFKQHSHLSSGILAKWPSHLNLLWLTIFETLAALHQPNMISFLILSFKLTEWHLQIFLRHFI